MEVAPPPAATNDVPPPVLAAPVVLVTIETPLEAPLEVLLEADMAEVLEALEALVGEAASAFTENTSSVRREMRTWRIFFLSKGNRPVSRKIISFGGTMGSKRNTFREKDQLGYKVHNYWRSIICLDI